MLHVAAKLALGPLLYLQAGKLKRTAVELPEPHGERQGWAGDGATALRVLVAGDSSAAGVGARTQDDALAAPLARRLAQHVRGRVHWQLVAQSGLTSEGVLRTLMHGHVAPADVAVIICGVNDITKEQAFAYALRKRRQAAEWLRAHAGVRHVYFPALPEMELFPAIPQPLAWWAGQAARRNNRLQQRWAQDIDFVTHVPMDGIAHPSLFCDDGFHPAPALYARVAQRLADLIIADRARLTQDTA
ncbi:MAG: SGNH/GDSL hydrolase family protein [Burkholderiaceae bacterium]|jgi:lysophospholipase L1-like esterase|nr:SGNH/GDSL hydrolase family protein [Burkholderiaceae bacterium]